MSNRFTNMADVHIAIISGRNLDDLQEKVGVEGITYAGCHGLEILHPDGQRYSHSIPQGYKDRLELLMKDLKSEVERNGAWVEDKGLLVAWHYREVGLRHRADLVFRAKEIYARHKFEILTVSKRLENCPPLGFNRGDCCIHILRWVLGLMVLGGLKVVNVPGACLAWTGRRGSASSTPATRRRTSSPSRG